MTQKLQFYERYGVEEYYIYDPKRNHLTGLQRQEGNLTFLENVSDWTSPRLGIRFVLEADTLVIYYPDGQRFLTTVELAQRAEQEKQRADAAEVEIARLKQMLQQAGINADEVK